MQGLEYFLQSSISFVQPKDYSHEPTTSVSQSNAYNQEHISSAVSLLVFKCKSAFDSVKIMAQFLLINKRNLHNPKPLEGLSVGIISDLFLSQTRRWTILFWGRTPAEESPPPSSEQHRPWGPDRSRRGVGPEPVIGKNISIQPSVVQLEREDDPVQRRTWNCPTQEASRRRERSDKGSTRTRRHSQSSNKPSPSTILECNYSIAEEERTNTTEQYGCRMTCYCIHSGI